VRIATIAVLLALLVLLGPPVGAAPEAPRVVSMTPANGATDVDPGTTEIRIVFSEPMRDGSWSVVGGGPTFPALDGIRYEEDGTVLVMTVRLKPGWTYRFGLNSPRHRNFASRRGAVLDPVIVTFRTSGETPVPEADPDAPRVTFDLLDANGVRVRSQDYAGVPIFLMFGACW
jgi:hypothetical protein